jgi:DNA-directed RNA polymerase subunit RPC12/RpoP
MWTKYDYVCSDCDALIEITTLQNIREWRGWCSCGSPNLINIGVMDATVPEAKDLYHFQDVIEVTPPKLVKINTNPYN